MQMHPSKEKASGLVCRDVFISSGFIPFSKINCGILFGHFKGKTDEYSRIDYILLSPELKRNWLPDETYIPTIANWGLGSDHRPIVVGIPTTVQ